jgi:hypothetical protein
MPAHDSSPLPRRRSHVGFLLPLGVALGAWPAAALTASGQGPSGLTAVHRSGQTFLTWQAADDAVRYRIYRDDQPIDASNVLAAELLYEVQSGSGNFYADRYHAMSTDTWQTRYVSRYVIEDLGAELAVDTELLVWTLGTEDLGQAGSGQGYYAVTAVDASGSEDLSHLGPGTSIGPVAESIDSPRPVLTRVMPTSGALIYTQFMDLRWFNPTLTAPNAFNDYYGLDPSDAEVSGSIQYAFTYGVFEPQDGVCGLSEQRSPVAVNLHGHGGQKARPLSYDPDPTWCNVYRIYPFDIANTWWFGHAAEHDYRTGLTPPAGDVVKNFTEQRVLMMVQALLDDPTHGPRVDEDRVYVYGTSMGGSGTLSMAMRYPQVFAAAHASQPMTNYLTAGDGGGTDWSSDLEVKFGQPGLGLTYAVDADRPFQAELAAADGTPVWDWQNHQEQLTQQPGAERVPLGIDHGLKDTVIEWSTQGAPLYPILDTAGLCWAGEIFDVAHQNSFLATLPQGFSDSFAQPFWGFQARRDESVPGFRQSTGNAGLPPTTTGEYNASIDWSSSWKSIDGAPLDSADRWELTLRSTADIQVVDVLPRRLQQFLLGAGEVVRWENQRLSNGAVLQSGTAVVGADRRLVVPGVWVTPTGTRLVVERSLVGDVDSLSLATGGTQQLELAFGPELAGDLYYVLGSTSGTSPGVAVGLHSVPLNVDSYLLLTVNQPNSSFLASSLSVLDADGRASCQFNLPTGLNPALVGLTVHHAALLFDLSGETSLRHVTPAVGAVLAP